VFKYGETAPNDLINIPKIAVTDYPITNRNGAYYPPLFDTKNPSKPLTSVVIVLFSL